MNILIVGNGFDLSHYLPTKYDHFMDVMRAIEEKDTGQKIKDLSIYKVDEWMEKIDKMLEKKTDWEFPDYAMSFDALFSKTREFNFIEKTKEFYLTENIKISTKDVLKLQCRLELNRWYQYFKKHVKEVKNWIDFELKIEEVIFSFAQAIPFIEQQNRNSSNSFSMGEWEQEVGKKNTIILESFNIFEIKGQKNGFNKQFCYGSNDSHGMNSVLFLSFAYEQLEEFIKIFDLYLELVVSQLTANCLLGIDSKDWVYPDKIFSFNYTNTFQRIYDLVDVEYLHGGHGQYQNIVLGISDIEDNGLKKIKAFGFTKYHQKLFKDTDYLFLDSYKEKIKLNKKEIESLNKQLMAPMGEPYIRALQAELKEKTLAQGLELNFYIWGHSLDVSDKDYIIDLFSLNDDIDRNVRVIVYHFNKTAKFDLLNNLLAILGKDKVEQWMKNKWLAFKPNPEIKFGETANVRLDQVS
ncbi:AbiH family protein [Acinetobacter entericus]|jgi:hypothetical protein|uniref:Bacteriophage abortive infection AbiH family protein n=2 Tax=Acinetobacter TaxID=469 RepID=A0ABT3NFF0_9GAMM|nr:AbiH family protein [Acinetobacter entericus]MCW8038248.1 bacteriophage abortive infection AbiH family protein [Acinetobacter entericus]